MRRWLGEIWEVVIIVLDRSHLVNEEVMNEKRILISCLFVVMDRKGFEFVYVCTNL